MQLAASNVGRLRASLFAPAALSRGLSAERLGAIRAAVSDPLARLVRAGLEPWIDGADQRDLLARGYAEILPDSATAREIALRARRNPLEFLRKAIIEFTTRCDFGCPHCYNSGVGQRTEGDLDSLASATDALGDIGIGEFSFIGGEVSRFGDGWLDLAARIASRGAKVVSVLSNSWFLGRRGFEAAGKAYADEATYFADLREHGLTHIGFSVDGRGEAHDGSRGQAGLYLRILEGIDGAKRAGLKPRVSILSRDDSGLEGLVEELGSRIYGDKARALLLDRTNLINDFVDLRPRDGAAEPGGCSVAEATPELLRCAGFYRPAPSLTIKANGEVATCRIANAGEGYGNIHDRPLVEILNGIQDSFIFRLHAQRLLGTYLPYIDREVFPGSYSHPCALRAIATMVARRVEAGGVGLDDRARILAINREVARALGAA
jgi:MoaA/NifB/PqqE/SkfB family radical SAM enzyme